MFRGRLSGEEVKNFIDGVKFPPPGKTNKKLRSPGYGVDHHWTHFPMFYELPYWSSHTLRHSIDIMHTEKNVFENIFFTIVNGKKSKFHAKARSDCKHFGVLPHLWIDENGKKPKAPFVLNRKQQKLLCEWIYSLKLPDAYVSNISRCCNVEDCAFFGFKSHDCHIFLQKLLPLSIQEFLPQPIVDALSAISNFFQDFFSYVIMKTDLDLMEKSVIKALCLLETIFPQSWYDSMEHLLVFSRIN